MSPRVRVAALFLILAALVHGATLWRVAAISRDFTARSSSHLNDDVAKIRARVLQIERELDASAQQIVAQITPTTPTAELFQILGRESTHRRRGARVLDADGEPVAWWGDDLRVSGARSYEFDVTNLYITRSRKAGAMTVQVFARVENIRSERSHMRPDDAWLQSIFFHGGFLKQEEGTLRRMLVKQSDASLWLDIEPRPPEEVIDIVRTQGRNASIVLLALGALAVMALSRRSHPALIIVLILAARFALLPLRIIHDDTRLFGFELYGSNVLGPFSKSPFDLLVTAAAILGIVAVASRYLARVPIVVRIAIAIVAAFGYVELTRNFVGNSRVSAIPDHVLPGSLGQGVLLGAMLLLAFAVVLVPASAIRHRSLAMLAMTLGVAALVYLPAQHFEEKGARNFISETYAPLVAGEAGQVRTMIEDTLRNEFSSTDLSTILPDDYRHMNLEDLAYALWLRSDLSQWRVPAVITITDEITRSPLSRFGVGIPQFSETVTGGRGEVLQVGSFTRALLHHDFDVTALGTIVALGSVHILNPADPGATAFADVYRDFFESEADDRAGLHPQPEPAVYDSTGDPQNVSTIRLPRNPVWYFARMKPASGTWVTTTDGETISIYLRRSENALYAFPLLVPSIGQHVRRSGGVAIWALVLLVLSIAWRSLPQLIAFVRRAPGSLDFRARTSLYVVAVVILPLILFVLFVRAYLADRLATEYVDRGQTALNTGQRVIEDYLSTQSAAPEQLLDDEVLAWLARVIGHDLHFYRGHELIASSRRDLFAAHVESERLPGDVYSQIVLGGKQLVRAFRKSGATQYVEIYIPVNLAPGKNYTLALPFIVQGRQIEAQVNDLATTIYMLLIFIALAAIAVAFQIARGVTRPVQGLVAGARAVARGDFDVGMAVPRDPDLGLLVTTFRDMARSIRSQQDDLRHERDRLQTLLENINAAVVVLDGEMRIGATNAMARRLFGLDDYENDRFEPRFDGIREMLAEHRARHIESREVDVTIDGNERIFRVSIVPLPDTDEEMLIAEDVTEILRSNRLEAWGEMARQV
ncbi:MAG TPA: HAMP domain-containing protein, partial [Thermoanaerobaculia bacterium]|nr:HAMP domain-containing protein [Thermoanaerobaculia bacterium]